jgi:hypothetical protein
MRLTFLTVCMIMLYNGFPEAARAQDYPWCVVNFDRTDCSFTTYEQCQATASGYGGCSRNKRTLWSDGAMPRWQAAPASRTAPAPATPPAARAGRTGGEAAHHQHRHHHHRQALEIRPMALVSYAA